MIYYIKGRLLEKKPDFVIVLVEGVGYGVHISFKTSSSLKGVGEEESLYTHLITREGVLDLYGFSTEEEKEWFKRLISVTKVGPKLALGILSSFDVGELALMIMNDEVKKLTTCSGVGPKAAQRIILELKTQVGKLDLSTSFSPRTGESIEVNREDREEAIAALMALGYGYGEVGEALSSLQQELSVSGMIKEALKILGRG